MFVTNELCQVFTASCVLPSQQDLQDIHSLWGNYPNPKTMAIKETQRNQVLIPSLLSLCSALFTKCWEYVIAAIVCVKFMI